MCKKDPKDCSAKIKCSACIKRQEMSKLREAYLEAKENGQVKSYKIVVDKEQKDDKLTPNQVDNLNEQQEFIIDIGGE